MGVGFYVVPAVIVLGGILVALLVGKLIVR
jgi:hypothetical protein